MRNFSKQNIFMFIAALYCSCLIVSNIIAGKTFAFFAWQLPCAVVIFPIVYILNDVMTEIYGFKSARAVVLTGFFANLIAVLAYAAAIALPSSQFFDAQGALHHLHARGRDRRRGDLHHGELHRHHAASRAPHDGGAAGGLQDAVRSRRLPSDARGHLAGPQAPRYVARNPAAREHGSCEIAQMIAQAHGPCGSGDVGCQ